MHIKLILPALTEARSPFFRPIKYSLFPPLGLATLAAYCTSDDDIEICDEHVEKVSLEDRPDLVVLQVYITSAYRSYQIADHYRRRGVYVVMGGLHVTSLPDEAAQHADTICLGPGEDVWPRFLMDFRARHPQPRYYSRTRSLEGAPCPRHDLIKRHKYLVPNSLVVSRGCPHHCDFCYKDAFFKGGKSFYNAPVEQAFCEIDSFPGRHLYFLDDNLFANPTFCRELFKGLHGRGRVWQAAATVEAVLRDELIESAAACGLRSLFIGFETLSDRNLSGHAKQHNHREEYERAIKRLHGLGVMINASFVFGMDHDDSSVFERTVNWAVKQGIETATFHILTPYPGTALYRRLKKEGRITTHDWDLYDTRHCVFRHPKLSASELERGYWWAYQQFYSWKSIVAGALTKPSCLGAVRHMAYAGAWKRCEPLWKAVIQSGMLRWSRPLLETCLAATKAISPGDGMAAKPIIPIQCQSHSPEPKFPWYQPASAQDPTGLVHPRAWE